MLSQFTSADKDALLALVNQEDTYAHIRQGNPWTEATTAKFLKFCDEDAAMAPEKRNNFYWAIRSDGALAGMIGLHTITYDKTAPRRERRFFVTFFIGQAYRGRGLGVRVLHEAIEQFHALVPACTHVYADVHDSNERSAHVLQKGGFSWIEDAQQKDGRARLRVGSKTLLRLRRPVVLPAAAPAVPAPAAPAVGGEARPETESASPSHDCPPGHCAASAVAAVTLSSAAPASDGTSAGDGADAGDGVGASATSANDEACNHSPQASAAKRARRGSPGSA